MKILWRSIIKVRSVWTPAWSTSVRQACRNCRVSLVIPLLASAASCNKNAMWTNISSCQGLSRFAVHFVVHWGPNRIMIEFGWCSTYSSTWAVRQSEKPSNLTTPRPLLSMNSGIWIAASGGLGESQKRVRQNLTNRSMNSNLNDGLARIKTRMHAACRLTIHANTNAKKWFWFLIRPVRVPN